MLLALLCRRVLLVVGCRLLALVSLRVTVRAGSETTEAYHCHRLARRPCDVNQPPGLRDGDANKAQTDQRNATNIIWSGKVITD